MGGEWHAGAPAERGHAETTDHLLSAVPLVKAGKLRALAVSSAERLPSLPDVPTVAELGYPGFDLSFWVGFFMPKATPAPILETLHREIIAAAKDPTAEGAARLARRRQRAQPSRLRRQDREGDQGAR